MSSKVQQIHSTERYNALIKSEAKLVIGFYTQENGPCKVMGVKYEALASKNENVVFAQVDIDEMSEVGEEAHIRALPTLHFYYHGSKVGDLYSADPHKLNLLVKELIEK